MKVLITLLLLTFFSYYIGYSQKQHFKDAIDFMSFTIKDTYAGYRDKVKGNEFDALVKKVRRSKSKDTFALLSQLTTFFKDIHVSLYDDSIRYRKTDTLQCKTDSQMVQQYFAHRKAKDPYEGYWLSGYDYCVIALKKVKNHPVTYYGYVAETKSRAIPGYCILKMTQQKDGTYYTDYIAEDLRFRVFLHARFKNSNTLWLNSKGGIWRRLTNYRPGVLKNLTTFSFKPSFEVLDNNTALLKMYNFTTPNMSIYDSIIKANAKLIEQSNTLIIDIRNNFGGYVKSYQSLFPFIYTGPIEHIGGSSLISNHFMKQYDDNINKFKADGDTASVNAYMQYRDTFLAKKGQLYYRAGDTLANNLPILPKPKNVAVIINNNCVSAAELMLLNFRQSSKVKTFGEPTGGAVDYLNVMTFRLPHYQYGLGVASSKRMLNKREPSYDGKGIPPDVEISDDVTDWVGFIRKYYENN